MWLYAVVGLLLIIVILGGFIIHLKKKLNEANASWQDCEGKSKLDVDPQEVEKLKDKHKKEVYWLTSILDALPMPISITDKDMNWTFINKVVEDMLGLKREDVLGKHCSRWGANICNTD